MDSIDFLLKCLKDTTEVIGEVINGDQQAAQETLELCYKHNKELLTKFKPLKMEFTGDIKELNFDEKLLPLYNAMINDEIIKSVTIEGGNTLKYFKAYKYAQNTHGNGTDLVLFERDNIKDAFYMDSVIDFELFDNQEKIVIPPYADCFVSEDGLYYVSIDNHTRFKTFCEENNIGYHNGARKDIRMSYLSIFTETPEIFENFSAPAPPKIIGPVKIFSSALTPLLEAILKGKRIKCALYEQEGKTLSIKNFVVQTFYGRTGWVDVLCTPPCNSKSFQLERIVDYEL